MENKQDNINLQNDVLHFEHHSTLSAEEIAKSLQRHNRKHNGDAQKVARPTTARAQKH